ncbi:helix-turn-helix domain-containing protein [Dysgonomonas sp. Marseille-P4677]|uniref:helix-turn-helix transcriptional regulator n=1 Tax=Dysgonomonas sp. Marseille-P4677 TaxID=2364790 RepID=UPI0019124794|nr:helix-turn-helix domain-containing protein [Dysgonomonas sp. Marseille-P4677]MBK5719894.1 helix-turn-helix domain-containing protein [Dysgonomonas sp. Marseille-P4677]
MNAIQLDERLERIEKLLLINKKVLTLDEVCEYTGFSRSYVYKLTANGIIPFSKPNGKVLFFDKEKIDNWMLNNASKSKEEIESDTSKYILRNKKV